MRSAEKKYSGCSGYELTTGVPIMPTLFYESSFRGLPVLISKAPFVESWLERTYETIHRALAHHRRLFAIRIDLRFPQNYWLPEGQILGNDYLTRFTESLVAKLDHRRMCAQRRGVRVHLHDLRLIWAREYDNGDLGRPHFHLLLLLNGNAHWRLGSFEQDGEGLFGLAKEAWASALGLHLFDMRGLVEIPDNPLYYMAHDHAFLGDLFKRASYLCKVRSKSFDGREHSFGCSRK
jgi:hypothetical protein